jgi:hypothetical protein
MTDAGPQDETTGDRVLMRLVPSMGRRVFAVGVLYVLGALMIWIALSRPPGMGWAMVLVAFGAAALWAGEILRRATGLVLVLTEAGLRDSSGRWLARWDEIAQVERGTFALKPSNGFLLMLKAPTGRAWVPGLWWRVGRRVGVGGVTPMRSTKFMGEQMALRLAGVPDQLGPDQL